MGQPVVTFEDNLRFEKEKQGFFDNLYVKLGLETKRESRKGWDVLAKKGDFNFKIEEKAVRNTLDSIWIEKWQDTNTNDPGWIQYSQSDFLIYGMFGEPVVVYRLNMKNLKQWYEQNEIFYEDIPSDKGWGHTICKLVPINHLSQNIIKTIYPL